MLFRSGWWYALVSIPVFQFFLFRWLLRLFNWMRLMYRLSRLDLQLIPTHPDRTGGLGFVGQAMPSTAVIILAISSVLCAAIATQVTYRGLLVEQFTYSYGIFVIIVMLVFLGPFLVFTPQLIAVKRRALMDYGRHGIRLGQAFQRNWVRSGANDEPISANDISSIAGFERTYALVRGMKIFPLEFADLREIIIAVVLPVLPFVGTHIPLEKALKVLPKILV